MLKKGRKSKLVLECLLLATAFWVGAPVPVNASPAAVDGSHQMPAVNPSTGFEDWLKTQTKISAEKMRANISPAGAARGAVVASPSRRDPDYWFHWIRDAALVMDIYVQQYSSASSAEKGKIWRLMDDFIVFSRANQQAPTPTGLGEPKLHADGSVFDGPWGRPQNDGPPLRAVTLVRWAHLLLDEGQESYVRSRLYDGELPARTVIKADLEYTAHQWKEKTFDLWEEVKGDHYYTRLASLAAMREGAELAHRLGDDGAANYYRGQAHLIEAALRTHWDSGRGLLRTTRGRVEGIDYKNSDLDIATILGVLHADIQGPEFSVEDSKVMATALKVEESFRTIYAVNAAGRFPEAGIAIGRYPEDRYSGGPAWIGNPWVLTTAGMAEYLYKLARTLNKKSRFEVDAINEKFIRSIVGKTLAGRPVQPGVAIKQATPEMRELVEGLVEKGDRFMKRVRIHANPDGSLSEQIDRNSGFMVSARDLTWSYASFLTAMRARP